MSGEPLQKVCRGCKELKSVDDFGRCSEVKSGRLARCKPCRKKYRDNYRNGVHTVDPSSSRRNLVGEKFARLTVVEKLGMRASRTFYRCVCECGNVREVSCSKLLNGHTRSCGCIRIGARLPPRVPEGASMQKRILGSYKRGASKKRVPWELSDEKALQLFTGNCFYCGKPPSSVGAHRSCRSVFVYNGIDRVINDRGYTDDNTVSCCTECNFRKGDTNGVPFIAWVHRVSTNLRLSFL
jgi:hypothetical protein